MADSGSRSSHVPGSLVACAVGIATGLVGAAIVDEVDALVLVERNVTVTVLGWPCSFVEQPTKATAATQVNTRAKRATTSTITPIAPREPVMQTACPLAVSSPRTLAPQQADTPAE